MKLNFLQNVISFFRYLLWHFEVIIITKWASFVWSGSAHKSVEKIVSVGCQFLLFFSAGSMKENKSLHSPLKRTLRGYDHRLWTAIFAAKCCFCLVNKLPSQNDEATKSEPELFRPFVGMTSHTFIWNTFLNFHVEYLRRVATARKRCLISLEVSFFQDYVCRYFR